MPVVGIEDQTLVIHPAGMILVIFLATTVTILSAFIYSLFLNLKRGILNDKPRST